MKSMSFALAGASVFVLASISTAAQAAQPAPEAPEATAAAASEETALGEIVVTARRKSESLQEVPQVVNAVTGDTLQKLNIKDFRDIQSIVPGLSLSTNNAGFSSQATMRGVSFNSTTAAQPTVAFYMNDVVVQANHLFQTMFDIGQVEVLRGPQGTTRGVAAPSGAITVTTRKPDLSEFGGYVDVTATDLEGRNVNGAVNIPILQDVLAVRIAGMIDQNTADGTRSIYSKIKPRNATTPIRTSISYEPSDAFNANLTYLHLDKNSETFVPVLGSGFAGAPALGLAATPPIGEKDRVGVMDVPTENKQHFDSVQLQLDSRVFGQHLIYTGGYSRQHYQNREDRDTGQNLIGVPFTSNVFTTLWETSHELRLESEPSPDRMVDYVVGAYYSFKETTDESSNRIPASFLPGAFGSPLAPNISLFDPSFQIAQFIPTPNDVQDTSVFGTLTVHLSEQTEITGGLRHLWTQVTNDTRITLVPGGTVVAQPAARRFSEEHTIYAVSLKHRFTRDLMAYASMGTSYRPPYASTGLVNAGNDPVLTAFQVHPSEKSKTYEVGVKWTFLEGRGRLNASLFRQKFRDMPLLTAPVPYVANNGLATTVQNFAFTADPDAIVEGFDVDAAFQILPNWSISGQLSYADGRATDDIPCNDSNFDGTPDSGQVTSVSQFPAGVLVALCPGGAVSLQPYWNASFQTEYFRPVRDDVDAYVRGLFTYYPENARATPATVIDNYGLLNLYAGVRASDGAWDVGFFVRNALKTEKLTNLGVNQSNNINSALRAVYPSLVHNSGYFEKQLTPRREFGVNVRYAFGSR